MERNNRMGLPVYLPALVCSSISGFNIAHTRRGGNDGQELTSWSKQVLCSIHRRRSLQCEVLIQPRLDLRIKLLAVQPISPPT